MVEDTCQHDDADYGKGGWDEARGRAVVGGQCAGTVGTDHPDSMQGKPMVLPPHPLGPVMSAAGAACSVPAGGGGS